MHSDWKCKCKCELNFLRAPQGGSLISVITAVTTSVITNAGARKKFSSTGNFNIVIERFYDLSRCF